MNPKRILYSILIGLLASVTLLFGSVLVAEIVWFIIFNSFAFLAGSKFVPPVNFLGNHSAWFQAVYSKPPIDGIIPLFENISKCNPFVFEHFSVKL